MAEKKTVITLHADKIQKRSYVSRACEFCNMKHIQCDKGRPCQNCIKRNRTHLCRDVTTTKKRKPRTRKFPTNNVTRKVSNTRTSNNNQIMPKTNNNIVGSNHYHISPRNDNNAYPSNSYQVTSPNAPNYFVSKTFLANVANQRNCNNASMNNSNMVTRNSSYIWSHESSMHPIRCCSNETENTLSDITTYTTPKENEFPNGMKNTEEMYSMVQNNNNPHHDNHNLQQNNFNNAHNFNVMNIMNLLGNWDVNEARNNDIKNSLEISSIHPNHSRLQSTPPLFRDINGVINSITPIRMQFTPINNSDEMSEQVLNQLVNLENCCFTKDSLRNIDIPNVNTPPPTDFSIENINEMNPLDIRKHIKDDQDLFDKSSIIKSHNYRKAFVKLHEIFTDKKMRIKPILNESKDAKQIKMRNNSDSELILIQSIQSAIAQFKCFAPTMNCKTLLTHEMLYNKILLEYEQVLSDVGSIIIAIWRRSGEISFVNKKFLEFFECTNEEMLGRTKFIFEFWDDETTYRYMSKYSDTMNFTRDDAIRLMTAPSLIENNLTKRPNFTSNSEYCDLIKKDGSTVRSMVSINIEKDDNGIPVLVIGQLLPIKD